MPPLYSGQWIRPKSWTGIEGSSEGGKEWNQPHTYNSNSARSHFPSEKALQCQQILNLYRTREFIQAPSKANITGGEGGGRGGGPMENGQVKRTYTFLNTAITTVAITKTLISRPIAATGRIATRCAPPARLSIGTRAIWLSYVKQIERSI